MIFQATAAFGDDTSSSSRSAPVQIPTFSSHRRHKSVLGFVIRSEEDRDSEYSLKPFHDAVIPLAVFEEVKEVENFRRGVKPYNPAALADSHSGHPDQDEAVLAVRQTVLRMADNLEEEFSVAPGVRQLA
jgi:hypothetical protein